MIDFPAFIDNLTIEKVVNKGFGLAHYQNFTVFVEYALPGDIVKVEVSHKKKNSLFARIVHYYSHSTLNKVSNCSVNGVCGGCDWVNIAYDEQLSLKNQIIEDIYTPLKEIIKAQPVVASPKIYHYRNKAFLPLTLKNGKPVYGIFARSSHQVITHEKCFIQPEIFNQIADEFLIYLEKAKAEIYNEIDESGNFRHIGIRISETTGEILLIIVSKKRKLPFTQLLVKNLLEKFPQIVGIIQNVQPDKTNIILGDDDKILFGRDFLWEKLDNLSFKVHYKAFFQVNHSQTLNIYHKIKNLSGSNKNILDAFSGTGSIGIFCASQHNNVTFIESNKDAHLNAVENAELNNLKNCSFYNAEVETILPEIMGKHPLDLIIFDPPRKGIEESALKLISELKIPEIIYMSCNPSTQVRDLKILTSFGYKISELHTYDMFPHTWHVESLAHLIFQ